MGEYALVPQFLRTTGADTGFSQAGAGIVRKKKSKNRYIKVQKGSKSIKQL